jgi:hypothetical protein
MTELSRNPFEEVSYKMDEACVRVFGRQPQRRYLGMSQIGQPCARRIWLDWKGCPKTGMGDPGKMHRIFAMGHHIEAMLKEILAEAGYEIEGEQLEFEDFGGQFRGHCDGIIRGVTSKPHILEIKSASTHNFEKMRKLSVVKAKPEYEAQIQLYMGYAKLERGLFVVMNKNSQELYTERVHFSGEIFERCRSRARAILESQGPPEKDEGHCYYCDYQGESCDTAGRSCQSCRHNTSFDEAPVRAIFEKYDLEALRIGESGFCRLGEEASKGVCGMFEAKE